MRNHKSLSPEDLARKGPDKIALMVASEFYRAAEGARYANDVTACFHRARELMGVLETMALPDEIAADMRPVYASCRASLLEKVARQDVSEIRAIAGDFAQRFDWFGKRLCSI